MKKSKIILFTLRLFFYFSVTGIILIHPGISISFDRIGILQWFLIIPIEAVIAFLPASVFNLRNRCITAILVLFPLSIWAGGLSLDAFAPFIAGLTSFTLTFLLFHHPQWARIAVLEPFFLTWVCLRLLALSRSGEDIAGESAALTQFILVWSAAVFLFHNVVIYFCLFPQSSRRAGKEGGLFFLATFAVLLVTLVILPPDFVRNTVINNLNLEKIPERIKDSDNDLGMPRDSGGRRTGRPTIPGQGDGEGNGQRPGSRGNPGEDGDLGGQPGLRGLSEYDWQNRTERGSGNSGDSRQYMVMIVASEREPVYMGDSFRGQFDPVMGFTAVPDEPLNQLANLRLFVTWFDNERNYDLGRRRQEVFSLSTLPNKYLPYRPVAIDPTILSENSGPLRYIHQVVSNTHLGDPLSLVHTPSRNFSNSERATLAPYFEISLEESDREIFTSYLNETLQWWNKNRESIILSDMYLREIFNNDLQGLSEPVNEYLEKILAILTGFSTYQYNLSFDDDATVASIKEFLVNSKEGDCVEFSNAFALLGRLAGIPTRVVTGYLAAESLQTQAHLRGIAALRRQIPVLQEFDFNDLFMVTNMHSHSWAQFYIPSYGWLDFEATAFAIPPEGEGNFGTWDVVIPIIDETKVFSEIRKFPWTAVLRAAGIMAVLALVCAYILRYGREFVLYLGTRRGGRAGSRSLYLLLLSRLAADGRPIKPASKTALEYSQLFRSQTNFDGAQENPHFKTFADYYSQLRWREFKDEAERDERFSLLEDEYYNILKTTKRQGMLKWFIRIFSLRGLAYL